MLREIATLPNRMVSRRAPKPGFKLEAGLAVVVGVVSALGMAYVGSQALGEVEAGAETLRFQFIGAALRPFAGFLVLWIGYTVLGHLLAGVYGGRGPISRLFRASAWSLIPVGVWLAIRSLVIFVLFLDVDYPADPDGFSAADKYQNIVELGLDTPVYTGLLLAGVLFIAWSWLLLTDAVATTKNISEDKARKAAGIPAALAALYVVWSAVGHAGIV